MNDTQTLPIDTRVIKKHYKNYDFLARFWKGRYRGRIWKNKVKLLDCSGEDLDGIVEDLKAKIDQLRMQAFESRGSNQITANEYASAWYGVMAKLDHGLLAVLKLLARNKTHGAPMNKLQRLAGVDSPEGLVNMLNDAEQMLRCELLLDCGADERQVHPLFSCSDGKVDLPLAIPQLHLDSAWADALLQSDYQLNRRSA